MPFAKRLRAADAVRSGLALWALCAAACALPEGMNDECQWPSHQEFVLNLQDRAHRSHLTNDVRVAEELGVRFQDSYLNRGLSKPGWPQTRDDCDARLFAVIARTHSLRIADVDDARADLATRWDPAMLMPLAALYFVSGLTIARWIRKRFAPDETAATFAAASFAAITLCGVVLALGHLWGGAVEMLRLGNMHMTYRAERLGWHGYAPTLFAAGTMLFLACVMIDLVIRRKGQGA